jgi:hypothetical protein
MEFFIMTSLTSLIIGAEKSIPASSSEKAESKALIQHKRSMSSTDLGLAVGNITFLASSCIYVLANQVRIANTLLRGDRYQATPFSQILKEVGLILLGSATVGLTAGLADFGRRLIQQK